MLSAVAFVMEWGVSFWWMERWIRAGFERSGQSRHWALRFSIVPIQSLTIARALGVDG